MVATDYIPPFEEYWSRVKAYYRFTKQELREIIIAIFFLTFVFAFDDGRETFLLSHWLSNLFMSLIIVVFAFFLHETVHKLVGFTLGYREEFKLWSYGIAFAVLVTLLSKGKIWLPIVGGAMFFPMVSQRLGKFRYGLSLWYSGVATMAGPLANVFIAALVGILAHALHLESVFLDKFVLFNFIFGAINMLPIPPLDGFYGFMGGKVTYMFIFGTIIGFLIVYSLKVYSLLLNIFLACLIGFLIMALYYIFIERHIHGS